MSNRKNSLARQIVTIAVITCAWIIARTARRRERPHTDDSVYSINNKRLAALSLLFFAADIYAIPAVLRSKLAINNEELKDIVRDKIPSFDLSALNYNPEKRESISQLSDNVLKAIVAMPLTMLGDAELRRNAGTLGVLYLWIHAVTYTIYSFSPLGPAFVDKYRPVVYYPGIPEEEQRKGNNRNASYSGHTSSAACATFFIAKVYNDYHKKLNTPAKLSLYGLAYLPPLWLGLLRTRALKHFPTDILQAILIGGCCGIMIPEFYRQPAIGRLP